MVQVKIFRIARSVKVSCRPRPTINDRDQAAFDMVQGMAEQRRAAAGFVDQEQLIGGCDMPTKKSRVANAARGMTGISISERTHGCATFAGFASRFTPSPKISIERGLPGALSVTTSTPFFKPVLRGLNITLTGRL